MCKSIFYGNWKSRKWQNTYWQIIKKILKDLSKTILRDLVFSRWYDPCIVVVDWKLSLKMYTYNILCRCCYNYYTTTAWVVIWFWKSSRQISYLPIDFMYTYIWIDFVNKQHQNLIYLFYSWGQNYADTSSSSFLLFIHTKCKFWA